MTKKKVIGECRICGQIKQLSREHYIPRSAGGGQKITLYNGDELLKTLSDDENDKPRGQIRQSGLSEFTLCKECNELSGIAYDKEFARFYNGIHQIIFSGINIPEGQSISEYLEGKGTDFEVNIKPFNIAKRILVSFCSVEHAGLTARQPEIRKAILKKDYHPDTINFALYMSLHIGNSAFYGTIAALKNVEGRYFAQAYAGIESDLIAFYYTDDDDTKKMGLEGCIDITSWLTDYEYDETATLRFGLNFNGSRMIRFPLPE